MFVNLRIGVIAVSLLVALTTAGCANFGSKNSLQGALSNPPRLHDDISVDAEVRDAALRQIKSYYATMARAEKEIADGNTLIGGSEAVKRYLTEGISLVDSYCLRWFQHLEDFERRSDSSKRDYNIISQLGTTLIGLARLHPNVTALYGAANTAYTGFSNNLVEGLIVAPSSKTVKVKVTTVMQQRAAQIEAAAPTNFFAARHQLEAYADLCTYTSAKDLVDKSVDAAPTPEVSAAGQFKVASTGTFGPDRATQVLRKLWKPDGKTIDRVVATKLRAWLDSQSIGASITSFLYQDVLSPLRERALREIDF